ncbi:MAG: amino acid permease [Acidobacteriota bacterium]
MPAPTPASGRDLTQSIRLVDATAMVVGIIIGASIFVQPSEMTGAVPSIWGLFAAWSIAGLLTLGGALICAELSSAFPRTGGVYVYLSETLSPSLGFLWAWAMFWSMHSGIIAALAMIVARFAGYFVPLSPAATRLVALSAIVSLSAVNYIGVRYGSRLQTAFTAGKVSAVVLMVGVAFVAGSWLPAHFVPSTNPAGVTMSGLASAVVAALFAFGGWHMVTYSAGETIEPSRTIPRALGIGTAIVTVCYLALNAAYLYVLPLDGVAASTRVAADAADAILGTGGGAFMSGLVIFSTFGALAGIVLSGPRVYYSMGADHRWFAWLGAVHARFRTPHRAILLQAGWSSVLVLTGTYRALFTRVVYTEWIFFSLLAVGLIAARRRTTRMSMQEVRATSERPSRTPNPACLDEALRQQARRSRESRIPALGYAPRYLVPGYPMVPVLFALVSAGVVLNELASDPAEALTGLGIVLAGLPVYWAGARRRPSTSSGGL